MADKKTIGTFEPVDFPDFKLNKVTAKIDTGAYTGALHCTKIEVIEKGTEKILRFSPFDHPEITIATPEYVVKHVKSSNGSRQERYFIQTTISIHNENYPILLSLADRSEMKWPVLIGRSFLRKNNFLVDASLHGRYRNAGRKSK